MIEATIYFDKSAKYQSNSLEDILREFSLLNSKDVNTKQVERIDIRNEEVVVEEIRMIKPQIRGSVVAKGGNSLPISGSKKLNLQNTPIVLVREKRKPAYVFPCKIGERYYSVLNGITFLRENLPNRVELKGEMEDTLVRLILANPEDLEEGLRIDDYEHETPTGTTDIVLKDAREQFLVIEVEREATDSTVGQILRLSSGFEKHQRVEFNTIRAGVACYRIHPNVLSACERAHIEVWKHDPKSNGFKKISLP
ncbi:MAG: DUF91 domain-containing protein [Nitrososphaerota archaeon]|nr:DUF91 domain-containing protein [Nitrososphaerota archaeon]MDG6923404.1 DUF91 domain-containing protein [Nitrososphaerota archaeon]